MIGIIAVIVAGITTREYGLCFGALLPLLGKKSRDLGLIAYFFYSLYATEVFISFDIFTYDDIVGSIIITLSLILLLDDILFVNPKIQTIEFFTTISVIMGILFPEALIAGGFFYLAIRIKPKGSVLTFIVILVLVVLVFILKNNFSSLDSTLSQVLFLGGIMVMLLATTVARKNLKKVEVFR